ncbi:hypothetical protein OUZ56_027647 [Daphnia magna]|uniref:Uncharacterized protein n=1 Tax=Daphnia magna TaxID=35525 RepID=A0ABR0B1I4_9CRUS|nr:hypothetical protein OUZ56_027647 [Daphnia magna]
MYPEVHYKVREAPALPYLCITSYSNLPTPPISDSVCRSTLCEITENKEQPIRPPSTHADTTQQVAPKILLGLSGGVNILPPIFCDEHCVKGIPQSSRLRRYFYD